MKYIAPNYRVEILESDEIMFFNILSTLMGGGDTPDDTSDDTYKGTAEFDFDNL